MVLSTAVAFYSQAAAINYLVLLRSVLLVLCLPQLVMLCILCAYSSQKYVIAGLGVVLVSWLFVAELGMRALAL